MPRLTSSERQCPGESKHASQRSHISIRNENSLMHSFNNINVIKSTIDSLVMTKQKQGDVHDKQKIKVLLKQQEDKEADLLFTFPNADLPVKMNAIHHLMIRIGQHVKKLSPAAGH